MHQANYALFNFGDLGYPHWVPVSHVEMRIMWEGSQEMIEGYDTDQVNRLLDEFKYKLLKAALYDQVDDDWISRAVMVTAIQGHMGMPLTSDKFRTV